MARLVDVLRKIDMGDALGLVVVLAAGYLAIESVIVPNLVELVVAGLLAPVALWLGRSLKKKNDFVIDQVNMEMHGPEDR